MSNEKSKTTADMISNFQNKIKIAKIIIYLLISFCLIILGYCAYLVTLPKTVPWVVELSADGQSSYIANVESELRKWTPADATQRYFLSHYIQNIRSVSSDNTINKNNASDVYAKTLDNAIKVIDEWYKSNNPIVISSKETVSIPLDELSIVIYAKNIWKIAWRETATRKLDNQIVRDEQYEALLTVKYYVPDTERRKRENPIGLYITDYKITSTRSLI